MTVLTENVVLVRTRAQDLKSVRKLNCWGSELTDISVVRRMPNVEVLSLSVNSISTLADFAYCPHLQELYIRKNNIRDLNELCYLQDLPRLKSLWIADNPCTQCDKYRLTVLRALPSLEKLDNITVQPEEVDQARVHGLVLSHPLECSADSVDLGSTVVSAAKPVENKNKITQIDHENEGHFRNNANSVDHKSNHCNDKNGEAEKDVISSKTEMKNSLSVSSLIIENYDNQQTHFVREPSVNSLHEAESPQHPLPHQAFQARVKTLVDHSGKRAQSIVNRQSCSPPGNFIINDHHYSRAPSRHSQVSQSDSELDGTASVGDGYRPYDPDNSESGKGFRSSPYQSSGFVALQRPDKASSRILPKGGKNRNSNILSAVLCLIKELDYASLEVVETVIHCRMEEMED